MTKEEYIMKYTSNRNLNHMWAEMYALFYELNKREMESSGIKLTPYGKEVCGRRTSEDLDEIQNDKVERLWQALRGYEGMLTGRVRFWIRVRKDLKPRRE
jgi:hypothetical protein